MPRKSRNIEIKAVSGNFSEQQKIAESLSSATPEVLNQEDHYFNNPKGRLKLRITAGERGQLIYYERPDETGPKVSSYQIYETDFPEYLLDILSSSCGLRNSVRKTRYLYIYENTRIHLDMVEKLGEFIELEVIMGVEDKYEEGKMKANYLIERLGISEEDLIECSYIDLLEAGES